MHDEKDQLEAPPQTEQRKVYSCGSLVRVTEEETEITISTEPARYRDRVAPGVEILLDKALRVVSIRVTPQAPRGT